MVASLNAFLVGFRENHRHLAGFDRDRGCETRSRDMLKNLEIVFKTNKRNLNRNYKI